MIARLWYLAARLSLWLGCSRCAAFALRRAARSDWGDMVPGDETNDPDPD